MVGGAVGWVAIGRTDAGEVMAGQQNSKSKEPAQQLLSPVGPFARAQHRSAV